MTKAKTNAPARLLTLEEVGERINRCARVVKKLLIKHSHIRPVKVGRTLMLTEADYEQLIEALRAPAPRMPTAGTRAAPSASATPSSPSHDSRLDAFLKTMRKPSHAGDEALEKLRHATQKPSSTSTQQAPARKQKE